MAKLKGTYTCAERSQSIDGQDDRRKYTGAVCRLLQLPRGENTSNMQLRGSEACKRSLRYYAHIIKMKTIEAIVLWKVH
ncbi:hypothetical protein NECAME_08308 [Necator americanus]|uniref:Uncharacterized protein n=1 Tax=Necator americanus TaxID=51031 RepID=W2TIV2_NECAM|nr:hypothetical protein NECAME_08308 [Necator americanus]ETN81723.1 hypothetical protein NECAME_08308 [Necator americanus]